MFAIWSPCSWLFCVVSPTSDMVFLAALVHNATVLISWVTSFDKKKDESGLESRVEASWRRSRGRCPLSEKVPSGQFL